MNKYGAFTLKALRKIYGLLLRLNPPSKPLCEQNPDVVSQLIYDKLTNEQPCMIARFGAFELSTLVNYLGVKSNSRNIFEFIKGHSIQWWWNRKTLNFMQSNAGFFPITHEKIEQFCELMLEDIKEIDILGSWLSDERTFTKHMNSPNMVWLDFLNPFFSKDPWSRALMGRKVLIIHPFSETIKMQYSKRNLIYRDQNVLPEFELKTIKAVQSIGNSNVAFKDWFEALEYMKGEIDKNDYDFCLIGAGAYGLPLAAHVKRQGKKAIHLGGSLQLLFGIRGRRWDDPFLNKNYNFTDYINEHWVRPSEDEKPENANIIEEACYW